MAETLYDILEVDKTATIEEIKNAYRKLASRFHPDKTGGDEDLAQRFKTISAAYATLSDSKKRKSYDIAGFSNFEELEKRVKAETALLLLQIINDARVTPNHDVTKIMKDMVKEASRTLSGAITYNRGQATKYKRYAKRLSRKNKMDIDNPLRTAIEAEIEKMNDLIQKARREREYNKYVLAYVETYSFDYVSVDSPFDFMEDDEDEEKVLLLTYQT